MSKVSLTLGETRTKNSLTLESKPDYLTWDEAIMTWDDADFTWDAPKIAGALETKSSVSLTLESK